MGKVGVAYIQGYTAMTGSGAPALGDAANHTPRVRCLDTGIDDGSVATVVEIGNGRYSLEIRAAFSTAQGAGNYEWSVESSGAGTTTRGLIDGTVRFTTADADDLAQPGDAMDLVTDAVDADAVATDAVTEIATGVDTTLTASHGGGSWQTATGFAVAGDPMTLTAGERTTLSGVIDSTLTASHGAGAWVTATGFSTLTAGDVWDYDITANYTTAQRKATAGGALRFLRLNIDNRQEEDSDASPGVSGTLTLYEDNGTTVAVTWTLTDEDGNGLTATTGVPARRTASS